MTLENCIIVCPRIITGTPKYMPEKFNTTEDWMKKCSVFKTEISINLSPCLCNERQVIRENQKDCKINDVELRYQSQFNTIPPLPVQTGFFVPEFPRRCPVECPLGSPVGVVFPSRTIFFRISDVMEPLVSLIIK